MADRRRIYRVVGSFGPNIGAITVKLDDEIGPKLEGVMRDNPKIASRALRHTGWFIQKDMKEDMTSGRGTLKQRLLNPAVESRFRSQKKLDGKGKVVKSPHLPHKLKVPTSHAAMLRKHVRHPFRWMGSRLSKHRRMARSIGYEMRADKTQARVGWLSKSSVKWANIYQDGKSQPVTKAMLGYFHAIGLPMKKKVGSIIRTPADPFIPNWFTKNKTKMVKVFVDRFLLKYYDRFKTRVI